MVFNGTNTGIVYMTRFYAKANSNDLTTQDIVNLSNIALDEIYKDVAYASRTLQFDDPVYADDPYESYDIVSGTSRYSMATDGNSASVLGIRKVALKDSAGNLRVLKPISIDSPWALDWVEGRSTAGPADSYLQFGSTLVLPNSPNYSSTGGLKVFYKRMLKYFTSTDTTATPGFALPYHELVPLIAAHRWCLREGKNTTANELAQQIQQKKEDMKEFYRDQSLDNGGLQIVGVRRSSR